MEEEEHANSTNQTDADHILTPIHNTDSTHQHNNGNQIPTQNQVIVPPILGLDDTFTYDIHNAPDSDSLLYEILSRLPLKSVFRFKCVSKHWLNLISQHSFSRFCISRMLTASTASSSLPFRILYREQEKSVRFKVLAVSNGLILCCSLGLQVYYVCDPVSRHWVSLGRRARTFFLEGFVSRVNGNNDVTSYKIVRVEMRKSSLNYLNLDMYSSETGKWVEHSLLCPNPITHVKRGGGPISFNGILHWFVYNHGMVAFDPYEDLKSKSCRLIQFPADRDVQSEVMHDGLYRLCDGCLGKLRFFEVAPDPYSRYCFSMWDMKDYEKGEWCSEFKVTRSDLSSSDPELKSWLGKATFLPLSFHPFDLDIVYLRCVELACVVSYSIRNRRLDVACQPTGVVDDLSWRVVVPFVITRWPTSVPIPPVQKKKVVTPKDETPTGRWLLKEN
ncbi:putative F-box domain-containing protein [Helianthus annuus]|nr:putative F-box domain-containing protein [Helianthus annuus]